jgi:Rrf2 family protein
MRLTKQTSHAIRILIDCSRGGSAPIKVAQIAGRLAITQQNVFKIVNVLSHAGFIKATRGRHGGVQLARPAVDIRIGDVVRATETTHIEVEDGRPLVPAQGGDAQPINSVLDHALAAFISVLDQHTLADMARQPTTTSLLLDSTDDTVPAVARRSRRTPRKAPSVATL